MGKLKAAIVGCGAVAVNHVAGYRARPDVELVAACDTRLERARAFARAHGIPHAVTSPAQLADLGVDVASVCTPHPAHEDVVVECARLGIHVLCEKPIASRVDAAQRMIEETRRAGVTFGIALQRRFWRAARRIRTAIDRGSLGVPMLGSCDVALHRGPEYYRRDAWRGRWDTDGGGVLMTQATHYVDLLTWFMGTPVQVVAQAGTFGLGDVMEVEDTAAAVVTFESGAIATIRATLLASPSLGTRVSVTGSTGATVSLAEFPEGSDAVNDVWAIPGEVERRDRFAPGIGRNIAYEQVNAQLVPLHEALVADFVEAVRARRDPAVTGEDALRSLRIVAGVYESARRGGAPVRLDGGQGKTGPGGADARFRELPALAPRVGA